MVTVTNKEIYNKLLDIEKQVINNDNKIKLAMWVSSTSLTISMGIIFYLIKI